ncbi:MAG: SDR family oxidoreductase [Deltaproteobacteria bacterium]|nr:SDR family oxidoreductase [Deltaproteobacteria bacterium]MBW2417229.1 SDR family oxidoreductase [Deltaproteobacteria bacterium]
MSPARSVLVTGTSSGIGWATALRLDRLGFRVFAGVRRGEDADRLAAAASERLVTLLLDVTDAGSIEAARVSVAEELGARSLDGIVNNAGYTSTSPMEFVDVDELRRQFEVNLFGAAAVVKAFLPHMTRPGGRIVNISSGAGRIVTPLLGPYCASKYALVAISDAMRVELRGAGLAVSIVEPGFIETPMHEKNDARIAELLDSLPEIGRQRYGRALERLQATNEKMSKTAAPAEDVARAVEKALSDARPRARYPVTREARLLHWIGPFLTDRIRDAIFGRIVGL